MVHVSYSPLLFFFISDNLAYVWTRVNTECIVKKSFKISRNHKSKYRQHNEYRHHNDQTKHEKAIKHYTKH